MCSPWGPAFSARLFLAEDEDLQQVVALLAVGADDVVVVGVRVGYRFDSYRVRRRIVAPANEDVGVAGSGDRLKPKSAQGLPTVAALLSEPTVEAFEESVLSRLARFDRLLALEIPSLDDARDELRAVARCTPPQQRLCSPVALTGGFGGRSRKEPSRRHRGRSADRRAVGLLVAGDGGREKLPP